jgi:hypothetical protein
MKDKSLAYILCALGFMGVAGIHRMYLGRPISGLLYFFTFGFLGFGTVLDMILIPRMVDQENALTALRHAGLLGPGGVQMLQAPATPIASLPPAPSPEKQILRLAHARRGVITPQLIALETSLSLQQAREELDRLVKSGDCTIDIGEDGSEQYRFSGLAPSSNLV